MISNISIIIVGHTNQNNKPIASPRYLNPLNFDPCLKNSLNQDPHIFDIFKNN